MMNYTGKAGTVSFPFFSNITEAVIPNTITRLEGTFKDFESLTSVQIPNSVTSIGQGTFLGCTSLASIAIPSSVTHISGNAFAEMKENSTIYVQSQAVANLLDGEYTASKTTVVVDPTKF